jgi:hypothetical protein
MSYYVYLISSLPMLHFGAKPPFSSERFLKMCEELIPETDLKVLEPLTLDPLPIGEREGVRGKCTIFTLARWFDFDTALRNELVKIRASRKHIDPAKYLRKDSLSEPSVAHAAMNAYRNTSILEAEKMLDQERWRFLDEISFGHYFDIDFLVIYALKLRILERWEKIDTFDKAQEVERLCYKNEQAA